MRKPAARGVHIIVRSVVAPTEGERVKAHIYAFISSVQEKRFRHASCVVFADEEPFRRLVGAKRAVSRDVRCQYPRKLP